jgi:HAD superfamily hydrolase (TIGR01458 family)
VIVGDLGERWTYALLQRAFEALQQGADLIACSRDRWFRKDGALALDAGPFVAALEYAARKEATVAGKPSSTFFHDAVGQMGLAQFDPWRIAMVGDDLWSDVQGAQRAGYQGWAVRTGKFRAEDAASSGVRPDRVLASVADVLELLP